MGKRNVLYVLAHTKPNIAVVPIMRVASELEKVQGIRDFLEILWYHTPAWLTDALLAVIFDGDDWDVREASGKLEKAVKEGLPQFVSGRASDEELFASEQGHAIYTGWENAVRAARAGLWAVVSPEKVLEIEERLNAQEENRGAEGKSAVGPVRDK